MNEEENSCGNDSIKVTKPNKNSLSTAEEKASLAVMIVICAQQCCAGNGDP